MNIQVTPYCEQEELEENFPGQQKFVVGTGFQAFHFPMMGAEVDPIS